MTRATRWNLGATFLLWGLAVICLTVAAFVCYAPFSSGSLDWFLASPWRLLWIAALPISVVGCWLLKDCK